MSLSAVQARSVQAPSRFAMDDKDIFVFDRSCCVPDPQATVAAVGIMQKCQFTPFEFFCCADLSHQCIIVH